MAEEVQDVVRDIHHKTGHVDARQGKVRMAERHVPGHAKTPNNAQALGPGPAAPLVAPCNPRGMHTPVRVHDVTKQVTDREAAQHRWREWS